MHRRNRRWGIRWQRISPSLIRNLRLIARGLLIGVHRLVRVRRYRRLRQWITTVWRQRLLLYRILTTRRQRLLRCLPILGRRVRILTHRRADRERQNQSNRQSRSKWHISSIYIEGQFVVFKYDNRQRIEQLVRQQKGKLRLVDDHSVYLPLPQDVTDKDRIWRIVKVMLRPVAVAGNIPAPKKPARTV